MKYLVTFQDNIRKMTVEAESESEAAAKAFRTQKQKDKYLVTRVQLITEK